MRRLLGPNGGGVGTSRTRSSFLCTALQVSTVVAAAAQGPSSCFDEDSSADYATTTAAGREDDEARDAQSEYGQGCPIAHDMAALRHWPSESSFASERPPPLHRHPPSMGALPPARLAAAPGAAASGEASPSSSHGHESPAHAQYAPAFGDDAKSQEQPQPPPPLQPPASEDPSEDSDGIDYDAREREFLASLEAALPRAHTGALPAPSDTAGSSGGSRGDPCGPVPAPRGAPMKVRRFQLPPGVVLAADAQSPVRADTTLSYGAGSNNATARPTEFTTTTAHPLAPSTAPPAPLACPSAKQPGTLQPNQPPPTPALAGEPAPAGELAPVPTGAHGPEVAVVVAPRVPSASKRSMKLPPLPPAAPEMSAPAAPVRQSQETVPGLKQSGSARRMVRPSLTAMPQGGADDISSVGTAESVSNTAVCAACTPREGEAMRPHSRRSGDDKGLQRQDGQPAALHRDPHSRTTPNHPRSTSSDQTSPVPSESHQRHPPPLGPERVSRLPPGRASSRTGDTDDSIEGSVDTHGASNTGGGSASSREDVNHNEVEREVSPEEQRRPGTERSASALCL